MIEVKNITKRYGSFEAVKNVSFNIKEGEIVGLLGPNGAGKSTTMNMLTGYIEPAEGEILINGINIEKNPKKAKLNIGYMPENVPLYQDLTVKEFVRYMAELKYVPRKEIKEHIEKIIKETGLSDVKNKLIKNLSRGYKQRTSLAGALVGSPKVLVLDEPTIGLDPKQIIEIRELIKSLAKNHTVILSSHILSEVSQVCSKVIIINKGEVIAEDTPSNLEEMVSEKNVITVNIEDPENKIMNIKEKIKDIEEIKLVEEKLDGTKVYQIISNKETDLRKILFETLPKENIVIFELKKTEITLEDAFIKLINKGGEK